MNYHRTHNRAVAMLLAGLMLVTMVLGIAVTAAAEEAEKTLTIIVSRPATIEDMNTNDFSIWLQEKTGVKVTYEQIPAENVAEKVALVLAGNDLPDAFLNCGGDLGLKSAQLVQYGAEDGIFLALDDLIEQYAPNLKAALEPITGGLDTLREVDGHIYALPSINPCFHCSRADKMWVNNNWVEALGLEMPTTTDEFYELMKAFKENDPNGNGIADEIPLAGSTDGWHTQSLAYIIPSFLYFDYAQEGFMLDDNRQVVSGLSDARFQEAMRYCHKLYAEGLLYEGTLTQKNDQLKKLVENPDANLVGATSAGYGGQFSTELHIFSPVDPLSRFSGI